MAFASRPRNASGVPAYMLEHRHDATECGRCFAAWKDFTGPLRGTTALATCRRGGHQLWWVVEADDPDAALALLPHYLAQRTTAVRVDHVEVP
jgi:hypothetical protein